MEVPESPGWPLLPTKPHCAWLLQEPVACMLLYHFSQTHWAKLSCGITPLVWMELHCRWIWPTDLKRHCSWPRECTVDQSAFRQPLMSLLATPSSGSRSSWSKANQDGCAHQPRDKSGQQKTHLTRVTFGNHCMEEKPSYSQFLSSNSNTVFNVCKAVNDKQLSSLPGTVLSSACMYVCAGGRRGGLLPSLYPHPQL